MMIGAASVKHYSSKVRYLAASERLQLFGVVLVGLHTAWLAGAFQ